MRDDDVAKPVSPTSLAEMVRKWTGRVESVQD
jgi:hypothetical protein